VEPGARVQIPASALKTCLADEADFLFWAPQLPYRFFQCVLGHPRDVKPDPLRGLQNFPVDVEAGRLPFSHPDTCSHMVPCVFPYLMPSKGKAEAVAQIARAVDSIDRLFGLSPCYIIIFIQDSRKSLHVEVFPKFCNRSSFSNIFG
jgi:hypothetical protein